MIVVAYGGQKLLTANFFEYDGGPATDPTGLSLSILDPSSNPVDDSPFSGGDLVHVATGQYSFTWNVPLDATEGVYTAVWSGTIDSVVVSGSEQFQVTDNVVVTESMGTDFIFEFAEY